VNKKYGAVLLAVAILLLVPAQLLAGEAISSEKKAAILELMSLTRTRDLGLEMKKRVISALRDSFPSVPVSYWNTLKNRIDEETLLSTFIPIYDRHLSLEDLRGLIAFYKTPAGRHYLSAKETMVLESVQEGKKWAMGWILQVFRELKAKGYKPAKGPHTRAVPPAKHPPAVDSKPHS